METYWILSILFTVFISASIYFLMKDSDEIYKELKNFENRAMYGPKEDIVNLRKELFEYKKCWHKYHYLTMHKIFAIVDARQRYKV